ncbi:MULTISPECIES: plasmid partitioning protein RepB C-terminal domain-containing protein [unclassified Bradyrhizobium]|uniref:plasmid partitioning protein RepB C-terminal domain-containing protein n=1 Tax=unclassified Bradyrhizobium TaxID=2631580 RepID=UPI00070FE1BA|nr:MULTISPECIES: plasmid partitioning protein RepB C-terminal domain-containing protein [unclassified Bradyrhizobium]KQT12907.1 chromosome partitioning protein ParB [Bradyrhizobium sp. Leaf396]
MPHKPDRRPITMAFEKERVNLPIGTIQPLRLINDAVKKTPKYSQIQSSVREIGLVEPLVVARDRSEKGKYLLLDGHLRLAVLQELGTTETTCLVATDDEAFTYNKRVSRIATVQERNMILTAIKRGVPEERIAKVLNVNVAHVRLKTRLLDGICTEAVELLKDKHVPIATFAELRKMQPMRQIEAAQLMVAMNKFSITYAKSLVGATPQSQLVETARPKHVEGLTDEQVALMEQESANLDREFRLMEQSYGADHLDLVVATGYLHRLLENARIVRYLAQNFPELLAEFQKIAEQQKSAA